MEVNIASNCCNLNANSPSSSESQPALADFTASIETPDIRNWFSSYVYQSPELNSSYCSEGSLPVEGESKDSGLYVEDSEGEEDARTCRASVRRINYPSRFVKKIDVDGCYLHESSDQCDNQHKVPEYSDSLPSEPPDVRNWFSSYVYESPTLDTAEIGSDGAEENVTQKETTRMPIPTKTYVHSEFVPCIKIDTKSAQQACFIQENGIEDCVVETSTDEIFYGNLARVCEYSRLKDAGTMELMQREESNGSGSALCDSHNKSLSTKLGSPIKFNERNCTDEAPETENQGCIIGANSSPGWILPNHKSKQGNSDNINRGVSRYSGLTSAMKISANVNEKNARNKKHQRVESVVSPGVTTRKPLMEITNNVCSSGSNEIAGKWRCPQKRKPCKGPPLKQLRLEKWVHRV